MAAASSSDSAETLNRSSCDVDGWSLTFSAFIQRVGPKRQPNFAYSNSPFNF
jgi:hypothetical protein